MKIETFLNGIKGDIKEYAIADINSLCHYLTDEGYDCYKILNNEKKWKLKLLYKDTHKIMLDDYKNKEVKELLKEIRGIFDYDECIEID